MRRSVMVTGLRSVGAGVLAAGFFTYLFLSLAGRVLGPEAFAPVSSLWALVFIVGPGLFMPVQQEIGRLVSAHREERAGGHAVARVGGVAAVLAAAAVVVTTVFAAPIVDDLFDGDASLLWWFEVSVVAYALSFLARGVLSGLADFGDFGSLVVAESVVRLVLAAVLCLLGLRSASTFGAAIALAPLLSTLLVTRGGRRLRLAPGPHVGWREAGRAMGWLVAGAFLGQFLANAGPLFVQVIAPADRAAEAGRFLGALVIARLALYLFQAVQATLLPNLAALLAEGRDREFAAELRRLVLACSALVVVSTLGALALGPFVVGLVFGDGFAVSRATMALLAGATSVFVLAASLSGAAIAAGGHRLNALAWLAGSVAFVVVVLLVGDLFRRVELGYLVGSVVAAAVLLVGLRRHGRAHVSRPVPVDAAGNSPKRDQGSAGNGTGLK